MSKSHPRTGFSCLEDLSSVRFSYFTVPPRAHPSTGSQSGSAAPDLTQVPSTRSRGLHLRQLSSPPEGSAAKIDIEFIFMLRVCSGKTTVTLESRGNAFLQMERRAKTRKSTTPVLYLYMI